MEKEGELALGPLATDDMIRLEEEMRAEQAEMEEQPPDDVAAQEELMNMLGTDMDVDCDVVDSRGRSPPSMDPSR